MIRPWGVYRVLQDVEHLCDDCITHWPAGPVQAHCRMFSRWPVMPFNTCLLTEFNDRRRQGSRRVVMCAGFLGDRGDIWVVKAGRDFTQRQWFLLKICSKMGVRWLSQALRNGGGGRVFYCLLSLKELAYFLQPECNKGRSMEMAEVEGLLMGVCVLAGVEWDCVCVCVCVHLL